MRRARRCCEDSGGQQFLVQGNLRRVEKVGSATLFKAPGRNGSELYRWRT
ncbi:hypothetical protein BSIN_3807 [Burkholderia singularis]|uniref:Uncharacterized protein n=1 Tax=Burkholderia singularis TaxID=1503053 RepID=A0A238H628_9BURK|nr:hypothetical protein BSIN_3807 [Burkholderia singularis]